MKTNRLGRSDVRVSEIGYGCMSLAWTIQSAATWVSCAGC